MWRGKNIIYILRYIYYGQSPFWNNYHNYYLFNEITFIFIVEINMSSQSTLESQFNKLIQTDWLKGYPSKKNPTDCTKSLTCRINSFWMSTEQQWTVTCILLLTLLQSNADSLKVTVKSQDLGSFGHENMFCILQKVHNITFTSDSFTSYTKPFYKLEKTAGLFRLTASGYH